MPEGVRGYSFCKFRPLDRLIKRQYIIRDKKHTMLSGLLTNMLNGILSNYLTIIQTDSCVNFELIFSCSFRNILILSRNYSIICYVLAAIAGRSRTSRDEQNELEKKDR